MCPNPTPPTEGQCCPTCRGCSRAGQLFNEGESKPDVLDPCNQCTCKSGYLECVKRACPVCSRSVEYKAKPNTCSFRGQSYKAGEEINMLGVDSFCTTCKCGHGTPFPTIQCERKTCPSLLCPTYRQRLPEGQCCPIFVEAGVGKAQSAIRAVIAR